MSLRHIITARDFSRDLMKNELFPLTKEMERAVRARDHRGTLTGRQVATLFFAPSLHTRLSFESAMQGLGGKILSIPDADRDMDLEDMIRILCGYSCDAIVLRYWDTGGAERAAKVSSIPIINAGESPGEHPSQALIDIFTIEERFGSVDGVAVAMSGDLARGKTVISFCYCLAQYNDVTIYLVSPEVANAVIPEDVKSYLLVHGVRLVESYDLREVARDVDIVYQVGIDTQRRYILSAYGRPDNGRTYLVNNTILSMMRKGAVVMHPRPRSREISAEIDDDPRSLSLRQIENSVPVRMALLKMILA